MRHNTAPVQGTVYRRTTDGHRLKFNGDPGTDPERLGFPAFYRGWEAQGPHVFGKLVGPAWGWPWAYEVDPDQSWPHPESNAP